MTLELGSPVTDLEQVRKLAPLFIEEFLDKAAGQPRPAVRLVFHANLEEAGASREEGPRPIRSEIRKGEFFIHLSGEALQGIPQLALQGWLDRELGGLLLAFHPERFRYNFRRLILPLFPVSGSAEDVVRNFVNRLEWALKSYAITKMAIDADHALAQFYFYFYKLRPDPCQAEAYRMLTPHNWCKLLFLADKLKEYMAVCLVARQGISAHLKSYWWTFNEFVSQNDRDILDELAMVPWRFSGESHSFQLLEMFKVSRPSFAERLPSS